MKIFAGFVIVIIVGGVLYYTSNERIIVAEQTVYIENLPRSFENFKILQIADLHEKRFGNNQQRLTETINGITYDAVVITGDLLDQETSTNFDPAYELLDGITLPANTWFVKGNTDPNAYQPPEERTQEIPEFIEGLEKRGVKQLDSIEVVEKNGDSMIFADFEMILRNSTEYKPAAQNQYAAQLDEDMQMLNSLEENTPLISLFHYPLADVRLDIYEADENIKLPPIDLHIAGHYHGGQIRIPLFGALIVPEAYYDNYGLFPDQDRIRGLWEYNNLKQYVSTGLGASNTLGIFKFRLFNPPEVNLITLKSNTIND
ncbi:metallophosphoesterase [Alkalicoccus daliensis]|uniref:Calcineurin-like phosphoesterase domain-containing protein n=1 Tax=Alkalicoccus daliensis TaxID=745820 RepID=A0A1G9ZMZ5_9BACI|nr:metallophosphoesterase [Alkalicoccus daliensis]SDN22487.1 hypothetical protein SAMN04488053_101167 [Alkalicoccus daliensis]